MCIILFVDNKRFFHEPYQGLFALITAGRNFWLFMPAANYVIVLQQIFHLFLAKGIDVMGMHHVQ